MAPTDMLVKEVASHKMEPVKEEASHKMDLPSPIQFATPERAVLGIVLIGTDHNMAQEATPLLECFPGVGAIYARIVFKNGEDICAATYWDAYNDGAIRAAFHSIATPKDYVTVQGVGCTSLSFLLGRETLERESIPKVPLVDMWSGVSAAMKALNVKRMGLITPYIDEVHEKNVQVCREAGFDVVASMNFGCPVDRATGLVVPSYIADCAEHLAKGKGLDCVFLGCSGMRVCTPNYLSELEKRIGVPVVTSTQAFLWHMLRTAGVADQVSGYGKLFSDC